MNTKNRTLVRNIKNWQDIRQDWIDILVKNPHNSDAALKIITCNAHIDCWRGQLDWTDESLDSVSTY